MTHICVYVCTCARVYTFISTDQPCFSCFSCLPCLPSLFTIIIIIYFFFELQLVYTLVQDQPTADHIFVGPSLSSTNRAALMRTYLTIISYYYCIGLTWTGRVFAERCRDRSMIGWEMNKEVLEFIFWYCLCCCYFLFFIFCRSPFVLLKTGRRRRDKPSEIIISPPGILVKLPFIFYTNVFAKKSGKNSADDTSAQISVQKKLGTVDYAV